MRARTAARVCGWAVPLASAIPLPALACPACYSATGPRVLLMYYASTIALSLLPFAIVGAIAGLVLLLKRQLREDAEAAAASSESHSGL
jgi:hypothetical protein